MPSKRLLPLLLIACAAGAQAHDTPSRGQLLYTTHCLECHTTQMHWRDKRQAHDWDSLRLLVRHWQGESRLQWTEDDIDAVSLYLNDSVYRFGTLAERSASPGAR